MSVAARISGGVDAKLRKEQAGFRKGRSTIEQIFVLRNIVEQAVEWNSSLYVYFVDYEKAFDSVHRKTLWKIMESYGIPSFLHKSLRRILKIYWPMRITNEAIRARAGMETISKQVARRRLTWPDGNGVDHARPGEELSEAGKGRIKNMGSSSIGCGGQNSLEAESSRPNSPLGERINDDDDRINLCVNASFNVCQLGSRTSSTV